MKIPEFSSRNKWFWAVFFFPLVVDFINTQLYDTTIPAFLKIFNANSEMAGWLIIGVYLLFIFSLLSIGRLAPYKIYRPELIDVPVSEDAVKPKIPKIGQYIVFISSAGFGIIMLMLLMHSSGLYDEMVNATELSKSKEWVFWIGMTLFFVQIFSAIGLAPKYRIGSFQYFIIYALNVLIAALLVSISTAAFGFFFAGGEIDPHRKSKLIEFLLFFIVYFFFFASPRLLFLNRNFNWLNLASALIAMGWFLWNTLNYIAL